MRKNNNSTQKQIDKMNYENYMRRKLIKLENENTQIINNNVRTYDLGFVVLAIINRYELKEILNEQGLWLINNGKDLYEKYKNKETLTEPLVFSRTLINIINKTL